MAKRYRRACDRSSLTVGLSLLGIGMAQAGHLVATANTIRVTATQAVAFGKLLNDLASGSAETVSFTANGDDLVGGIRVLSVGGTIQPAAFTLSASETAMSGQTITVSATGLAGGGTATSVLSWRWLKLEYGGTQTTQASQTQGTGLFATLTGVSIPTTSNPLRVFGAVEVEGGDPAGRYTGAITVTANHQ